MPASNAPRYRPETRLVHAGQIRFRRGEALLDAVALAELNARERLVDSADADVGAAIAVSVDLTGERGLIGYRAKRHTGLIDIERRAGYEVGEFWEPMAVRKDRNLILDPNEFYILASKEAVQVPPDYAAEMVPFDPLVGEFRVHYAGFFDPGFGHSGAGGRGSRAVLDLIESARAVGNHAGEHVEAAGRALGIGGGREPRRQRQALDQRHDIDATGFEHRAVAEVDLVQLEVVDALGDRRVRPRQKTRAHPEGNVGQSEIQARRLDLIGHKRLG